MSKLNFSLKNYMTEGVSSVVSLLLLIVLVTVGALIIYLWISPLIGQTTSSTAHLPPNLKAEAFKVTPSGGVIVYVRNIGETTAKIDAIYFIRSNTGVLVKRADEVIKPGEAKAIVVDSFSLRRVASENGGKCYVKLSCVGGSEVIITIPSHIISSALKREPQLIGLRAITWSSHWIILDYSKGYYKLYGDYGPGISGRTFITEDYAPILNNVDEYTIAKNWVSWNDRPVNSPVIVVINPTKASQDWIFTWHDPHGTYKFYLEKLQGQVELDFLIFWEDLYYPPTKPNLDDWKDHVIRVTVFSNGTYRIAVYLAKGGYSHEFYLGVEEPYENLPDQFDKLIYTKPHGEPWSSIEGGYYREMSDKIFIVTIG